MSTSTRQTCQELRRIWKPAKERLQALDSSHPTVVRVHRSLSWLARVESEAPTDSDLGLFCRWVALNSLYGQWDAIVRQPVGDRESLRAFLERILQLDTAGQLRAVLTEHKALVLALLEDKYLNGYFWDEPEHHQEGRSKRERLRAQSWYVERRWLVILESVLERIYLLRCQLVHGAATFGGKLNRTAVGRSTTMLGHLVPAVVRVVIEQGADEDWGIMCYPPLRGNSGPPKSFPIRPR